MPKDLEWIPEVPDPLWQALSNFCTPRYPLIALCRESAKANGDASIGGSALPEVAGRSAGTFPYGRVRRAWQWWVEVLLNDLMTTRHK